MNVLALGNLNSVFIREFVKRMNKKAGVSFDILARKRLGENNDILHDIRKYQSVSRIYPIDNSTSFPVKSPYIYGLYQAFRTRHLLNSLDKYNICHIHYLHPAFALNAKSICKVCDHLVVSFWGSDFYQTSTIGRYLQKRLLNKAEIITFANRTASEDFLRYFHWHYSEKIRIARFGLVPLEMLKILEHETKTESRKHLGLPEDDIIVSCAYSGTPLHQHMLILESIYKVLYKIPKNVFVVLPITYGGTTGYKEEIKNKLNQYDFKFKVFENYLSDEDTARLRKSTDILINVPQSDQFSGSMLEHIYAGNVVIAGDWLPYDLLDENKVFMLKVSSIQEVGEQLIYAINNFDHLSEQANRGKDIIWDLSSWDANIPSWIEIYDELEPDQCSKTIS